MSDTRTRCPNKHPGTRGQCGLPAGHDGDHTLLVESGTPWFTPVSPVASSATPTPGTQQTRCLISVAGHWCIREAGHDGEHVVKDGDQVRVLSKVLESEVATLRAALTGMVNMYVQLVDSGDAGFWNPEEVEEVIAARSALTTEPR